MKTEAEIYKEIAEKLWKLLDDIDTSTDIYKPTKDKPNSLLAFYNNTNKITSKRFTLLESDGYGLFLPKP